MYQKKEETKSVKRRRLTSKEKGFTKDFVIGGNATEAAIKNYDTDSRKVAASIGQELLQKPEIIEAVEEAEETFKALINKHLPEESVIKTHAAQMNATRIEHMTFPLGPEGEDDINLSGAVVTKYEPIDEEGEPEDDLKKERTTLTDAEIIQMLADVNCIVKRIVHGNSARHVYFWAADNTARDKALDKAYKIRGRYVDEQDPVRARPNVTYNFMFSKETQDKIAIINQSIKDQLIHAKKTE